MQVGCGCAAPELPPRALWCAGIGCGPGRALQQVCSGDWQRCRHRPQPRSAAAAVCPPHRLTLPLSPGLHTYTMLFTNGLLTNDVLRWKAIGAAAWLAAITVAAAAAWSTAAAPSALLSPLGLLRSLFSPSGWLTTTALVVAQAPAFAAQTACLRGAEPRPPHINRLPLPRAAAGPLAVLLSKLAVRVGSVAGATRAAVFLGLHTLSAVLSLSLDSATRASAPQGACWLALAMLNFAGCDGLSGPLPSRCLCCAHAVPTLPLMLCSCSAMLPMLGAGASWTLQYSLWLAATFLLHYVYW